MDSRKFVKGYEVTGQSMPRSENPELVDVLEEPREWASFFSTLVYDYLNENLASRAQYATALQDYNAWYQQKSAATTELLTNSVFANRSNQRYMNEMNFHMLAHATLPLYKRLLTGEGPLAPESLQSMQTELATAATHILDKQAVLTNYESYTSPERTLFKTYNGLLTEIDTQIILLEIMKSDLDQQLIIIPAPSAFESGYNTANNADFLAIDISQQQSRGLQAKTVIGLGDESLVKYADDRITLIDGVYDLGNSARSKINPDTGRANAAVPGQISLDQLQLNGDKKSFIPLATANVRAKLMHDLYDGPTKPTRKFLSLYKPKVSVTLK